MLQMQYILPLTAASAVGLNEHRDFCFKTKCVNMAVMYILCALKLEPWLRSNSVSVFFITQLGHRNCLATIAFILDI